MNWKPITLLALMAVAVLAPPVSRSQQPARSEPKKSAAATTKAADSDADVAAPRANEIASLRASAAAFTEAFNRGT